MNAFEEHLNAAEKTLGQINILFTNFKSALREGDDQYYDRLISKIGELEKELHLASYLQENQLVPQAPSIHELEDESLTEIPEQAPEPEPEAVAPPTPLPEEEPKSAIEQLIVETPPPAPQEETPEESYEPQLTGHKDFSFQPKSDTTSLVNRLKMTAIKDIHKAIGLNEKFLFMNELFNGNAEEYKAAVDRLNQASSTEEAFQYVQSDLIPRYQWDDENKYFQKLIQLIERRHAK